MTDYTDPESPIADPFALERKRWRPVRKHDPWMFECFNCNLKQREHINNIYCPEWRLRQMDGDR